MKWKLLKIMTILKGISSRIYYWFSCHIQGYCPTINEINNSKVRNLASRLKANSYEESLTNILEWQDRNIEFWTERHPVLPLLLKLLQFICLICLAITAAFFIGILLLTILRTQILLIWLIQIIMWLIQNIWWFIVAFASSATTILAVIICILHFNRKFPWKKIPNALKNLFAPSISMNFLLENRLGVCRDYAKLTACLILNIYPSAEVYFVEAPYHIATGINMGNKLYMLDQRLPILTINRWIEYRKHRKSDKIERFDPDNKTLEKVNKKVFIHAGKAKTEIDTEKLARKLIRLLNIKERIANESAQVEILWKNGVILYEEDEFVDYSLARWLKMKISNELIKTSQITRIEVSSQQNDLMFLIHFSRT